MLSFRHPFCHAAVVVLALSAFACSSSPPAGEGNTDGALPAPESSADQVGSIPEDMLADEKGVDGGGAAGTSQDATAAADPFGDLSDKRGADATNADRDALLVPEDTKGGKSSEPFADLDSGGGGGASKHDAGGSGKMDRYTVKPGDTLMKIAFQLYGDVERWKDLEDLNKAALKHGVVRAGQKLRYEVPNEAFNQDQHAKTYEIKKGDTLAGIADEVYGKRAKYKKLQTYNKDLIKNPNRIFAGFTIYYDITEQEMADAEARRAQRAAGGGGAPPSAINPPVEAQKSPAPTASVTPQAIDNSAVQGPQSGPPAPGP